VAAGRAFGITASCYVTVRANSLGTLGTSSRFGNLLRKVADLLSRVGDIAVQTAMSKLS
jgi:hypothetical protein